MITTMMGLIIVIIILVFKMTKMYTHNMILMSRYKGQLHGGKRQKIWPMPSPPLFGQCPKENILFYRRCSLKGKDCFDSEWLFMCKKTIFLRLNFLHQLPFIWFLSSSSTLQSWGSVWLDLCWLEPTWSLASPRYCSAALTPGKKYTVWKGFNITR